jgi:alpha-L-fucosidase 2
MHSWLLVLVLVLLAGSALGASVIPGTRMKVDWPKLVSGQDIILRTPPSDPVRGQLLGNGDIGVSVYGPPDCIIMQVGKNDIWDYRDPIDEMRPPLTQKEMIEYYTDPARATDEPVNIGHPVSNELHAAYRTPMHTAKPAGQIRFHNDWIYGSDYEQELRLWDGEVVGRFGDPREGMLRVFVPYQRNVIVVRYTPRSHQRFDFELARHVDTTGTIPGEPEFGADLRDIWMRYKFPADATYPDGFEYVMYGRVLGGDVFSDLTKGMASALVRTSETVTLIVAIATTRESPDPFTHAQEILAQAQADGYEKLRDDHRRHWHEFWQRSFVQMDNAYLTQHWFVSNYHLACCSRPGRIAPGLYGNWSWQDAPAWWSDYHWDYNFQQAFWGAYSSNHLEQAIPYNETVLPLLAAAKTEAREVYGIGGAKFFLSTYPRKTSRNPYPCLPWDRCMSLSAWVAQEMWWYYLYSQDREYLRTQAYPVMRECAQFYEEFLTRADDGKYDIVPTVSPEHWGMTYNFVRNKNCLLDLTLIRYLMNACIEAGEILDTDAAKRPVWREIADNLREYPTFDTPEGKIYVDVEGAPPRGYNLPVPAMAIFPGNEMGAHSPPEVRDIALRTVNSIRYNLANQYIMLPMAKLRMGIDVLAEFEQATRHLAQPGGVLIDEGMPWIWVENFAAPIVINECLVQSYTERICVAPVKLEETVRFAGIRTEGAFLVSGEIRSGGDVSYVAITSEVGGTCRILRPWPTSIRVREWPSMTEQKTSITEEGTVEFETTKGAAYVIDRPDRAWEDQPEVEIAAPVPEPAPAAWRQIRAQGNANSFRFDGECAVMRIEGKAEASNGWRMDLCTIDTNKYRRLEAVVGGTANAKVYVDALDFEGRSIANTTWQPSPREPETLTLDLPLDRTAMAVAVYTWTNDGAPAENRLRSLRFVGRGVPAVDVDLEHIAP